MTVNIVMLVKDRPRLTQQALDSLYQYTDTAMFDLTVVDDASQLQTRGVLDMCLATKPNALTVRLSRSRGIVGLVRNLGIQVADMYWGREDLLYLSDNDACFTPGWLNRMLEVWSDAHGAEWLGVAVLGGYTHPYHQPIGYGGPDKSIAQHDAIGGFSQLMRWSTWERFGPFDAHAVGVNQSEDYKFCRSIVEAGYKVGCVVPHVVLNAGLTSTNGQPCVGHEALARYPGVLML